VIGGDKVRCRITPWGETRANNKQSERSDLTDVLEIIYESIL